MKAFEPTIGAWLADGYAFWKKLATAKLLHRYDKEHCLRALYGGERLTLFQRKQYDREIWCVVCGKTPIPAEHDAHGLDHILHWFKDQRAFVPALPENRDTALVLGDAIIIWNQVLANLFESA